ncbi:unnamed protein product [Closterium sp. Naga37s-1]|nr:unnamed protein product [Closterium sp. Naga37s-1]
MFAVVLPEGQTPGLYVIMAKGQGGNGDTGALEPHSPFNTARTYLRLAGRVSMTSLGPSDVRSGGITGADARAVCDLIMGKGEGGDAATGVGGGGGCGSTGGAVGCGATGGADARAVCHYGQGRGPRGAMPPLGGAWSPSVPSTPPELTLSTSSPAVQPAPSHRHAARPLNLIPTSQSCLLISFPTSDSPTTQSCLPSPNPCSPPFRILSPLLTPFPHSLPPAHPLSAFSPPCSPPFRILSPLLTPFPHSLPPAHPLSAFSPPCSAPTLSGAGPPQWLQAAHGSPATSLPGVSSSPSPSYSPATSPYPLPCLLTPAFSPPCPALAPSQVPDPPSCCKQHMACGPGTPSWVKLHRVVQAGGYALGAFGFFLGLLMWGDAHEGHVRLRGVGGEEAGEFDPGAHRRYGITLFVLASFQVHTCSCAHLHTMPCAHLHTMPCAHLHTMPCAHLHTMPCAHLHTMPCAHLHTMPCTHLHTMPCAHLHTMPCAHLHTMPCTHLHTMPCAHLHTMPCAHLHTMPCAHLHTMPCAHLHTMPCAQVTALMVIPHKDALLRPWNGRLVTALMVIPHKDALLRPWWNLLHHWNGRLVVLLGVINVWHGISLLHPHSMVWSFLYGIPFGLLLIIASLLKAFTSLVPPVTFLSARCGPSCVVLPVRHSLWSAPHHRIAAQGLHFPCSPRHFPLGQVWSFLYGIPFGLLLIIASLLKAFTSLVPPVTFLSARCGPSCVVLPVRHSLWFAPHHRIAAQGLHFPCSPAHVDQPVPTEEVGGAEAAQEGAGGQHEAATTSNLLYRCICNI